MALTEATKTAFKQAYIVDNLEGLQEILAKVDHKDFKELLNIEIGSGGERVTIDKDIEKGEKSLAEQYVLDYYNVQIDLDKIVAFATNPDTADRTAAQKALQSLETEAKKPEFRASPAAYLGADKARLDALKQVYDAQHPTSSKETFSGVKAKPLYLNTAGIRNYYDSTKAVMNAMETARTAATPTARMENVDASVNVASSTIDPSTTSIIAAKDAANASVGANAALEAQKAAAKKAPVVENLAESYIGEQLRSDTQGEQIIQESIAETNQNLLVNALENPIKPVVMNTEQLATALGITVEELTKLETGPDNIEKKEAMKKAGEAITKLQARFRGKQVRKEINLTDLTDVVAKAIANEKILNGQFNELVKTNNLEGLQKLIDANPTFSVLNPSEITKGKFTTHRKSAIKATMVDAMGEGTNVPAASPAMRSYLNSLILRDKIRLGDLSDKELGQALMNIGDQQTPTGPDGSLVTVAPAIERKLPGVNKTPLQYAAENGRFFIVDDLIDRGAIKDPKVLEAMAQEEIKPGDSIGRSAQRDKVERLIIRGFDPSQTTIKNITNPEQDRKTLTPGQEIIAIMRTPAPSLVGSPVDQEYHRQIMHRQHNHEVTAKTRRFMRDAYRSMGYAGAVSLDALSFGAYKAKEGAVYGATKAKEGAQYLWDNKAAIGKGAGYGLGIAIGGPIGVGLGLIGGGLALSAGIATKASGYVGAGGVAAAWGASAMMRKTYHALYGGAQNVGRWGTEALSKIYHGAGYAKDITVLKTNEMHLDSVNKRLNILLDDAINKLGDTDKANATELRKTIEALENKQFKDKDADVNLTKMNMEAMQQARTELVKLLPAATRTNIQTLSSEMLDANFSCQALRSEMAARAASQSAAKEDREAYRTAIDSADQKQYAIDAKARHDYYMAGIKTCCEPFKAIGLLSPDFSLTEKCMNLVTGKTPDERYATTDRAMTGQGLAEMVALGREETEKELMGKTIIARQKEDSKEIEDARRDAIERATTNSRAEAFDESLLAGVRAKKLQPGVERDRRDAIARQNEATVNVDTHITQEKLAKAVLDLKKGSKDDINIRRGKHGPYDVTTGVPKEPTTNLPNRGKPYSKDDSKVRG